jgi:hypothetical protein
MLATIRRLARRIRWGSDLTIEIRAHAGVTTWHLRSWKIYHTPDGRRRLNTVVAGGAVPLSATDDSGVGLPVVDHGEAVRWVQDALSREYQLHAGGADLALRSDTTWGHYGQVSGPATWI